MYMTIGEKGLLHESLKFQIKRLSNHFKRSKIFKIKLLWFKNTYCLLK